MADDSKDDDKGKKGKKEKGGKSNLLPAIVLAIGLVAGGYLMGGSDDKAAAGAKETTTTLAKGEISISDPISINLADGHFLKVSVGVQLAEGIEPGEFAKGKIAEVNDMLIELAGGEDINVLSTRDGRKKLNDEMTKLALKELEGEVLGFYFNDFVMQ